MSFEKEIALLEREWSPDGEGGFFYRLRDGGFDPSLFERALATLSAISISEEEQLPRRFVSLLWFIPTFMQWQIERGQEMGGDPVALTKAITMMTNEVERLRGVS